MWYRKNGAYRVVAAVTFLYSFLVLQGCAKNVTDTPYVNAREELQQPQMVTVDTREANFNLLYGNDLALESAFKQYTKTGKAPNIITDGFVRFAYNSGQMPIVKTVPFQETVISLEPGEKFTNISSGDPSRWSYAMAISGMGATQQQNILVKPTAPDLSTNMVVTTDRRIYNLRLLSGSENSLPTRAISFWYPDEMVAALNHQIENDENSKEKLVSHVDLSKVNFNYEIKSNGFNNRYSWQPIRVFDDGTHTYIQFQTNIRTEDMPALFIKTSSGEELVNYRAKAPYFVVDRIFSTAVLVKGVGRKAEVVTLTRYV